MEREAFISRLASRVRDGEQQNDASLRPERRSALPNAACVATLTDRLRDLDVKVSLVGSQEEARDQLEQLVRERGWRRLACSASTAWGAVAKKRTDQLAEAQLGLSVADWAIADTGTVVVCSSEAVLRSYSLVPPTVAFFVPQSRIRQTVGDVLNELPTTAQSLPSCVSFISGPSSTADLAGVHVVGVHGPGEVFVWIIGEPVDGSVNCGECNE